MLRAQKEKDPTKKDASNTYATLKYMQLYYGICRGPKMTYWRVITTCSSIMAYVEGPKGDKNMCRNNYMGVCNIDYMQFYYGRCLVKFWDRIHLFSRDICYIIVAMSYATLNTCREWPSTLWHMSNNNKVQRITLWDTIRHFFVDMCSK